jgi:hypothetical protein
MSERLGLCVRESGTELDYAILLYQICFLRDRLKVDRNAVNSTLRSCGIRFPLLLFLQNVLEDEYKADRMDYLGKCHGVRSRLVEREDSTFILRVHTIFTESFREFLIVGRDRFLQNPFKFIIHQSYYR